MEKETTQNNIQGKEKVSTQGEKTSLTASFSRNRKGPREFQKNVRRRKQGRGGKPRSEFEQKLISIRRVARVVAGGRRFSFSVAMIIGDKKGSVGVGSGKASDTALAIEKALRDAKKHMIKLSFTKTFSIPHQVEAKYSSSRVTMMPTALGKGIVAGSSVRNVLELVGVRDVTAKILSGSKNQMNNARAAVKALSEFETTQKN
ncbi:MAG: 30S ribosomal protein S5 [Candidatus Pacebacteria bacterium]|nr:30S ribosomal protein S5 [Candidatus Paceibacterota bacterium]